MNELLAERCALALAARAGADRRIRVLDGDLADSVGTDAFARAHPGAFIMGGIAEQNLVSMAAGMASCGLRPWVFSFAAFLGWRAADQIRVSVAQTALPVVMVGSHAGGCVGRNGKTHAALGDLAVMLALPTIEVWCPADAADIDWMVERLLAGTAPAYVRTPRARLPSLPDTAAELRVRGPLDGTVFVATGYASHWALEAQRLLADQGKAVGWLHLPRLRPLPHDALRDALARARRVIAVDDHTVHGGLGSVLQQALAPAAVEILGWPGWWPGQSGADADLRRAHGLDAASLAGKVHA
jgi:transketolase